MKLKKDWSPAYFLYYICWIGYWTIGLSFVTVATISSLMSDNGKVVILDVPVVMQVDHVPNQNELNNDGNTLRISESIKTNVFVFANSENQKLKIAWLYAIKMFDGLIVFVVLIFLSRVLKRVAEKDPFHFQNQTYLYAIGWTLIIGGCINLLLMLLPIPLIGTADLPAGYEIKHLLLSGDLYIFGGILVIVISYVFKEGTRIYEEQKLTV
ncbi:MAG: DUF2975 domain-containing protein [Balneolaceae bacterium]